MGNKLSIFVLGNLANKDEIAAKAITKVISSDNSII